MRSRAFSSLGLVSLCSAPIGCLDWAHAKRAADDASVAPEPDAGAATGSDTGDEATDPSGEPAATGDPSSTDPAVVEEDAGETLGSDAASGTADGGGDPVDAATPGACPADACPDGFPCTGNAERYACLGQFAQFPLPWRTPGDSFAKQKLAVDSDAGIVHDLVTGLGWERVAPPNLVFEDARAYCASLRRGGYADWRLPTLVELSTLSGAAWGGDFDGDVFFNLFAFRAVWSSTPAAAPDPEHWSHQVVLGPASFAIPDTAELNVLCVRTDSILYEGAPSSQFQVTADGDYVRDTRTHLLWERDVAPAQRFTGWADADAYCRGLRYQGYTFRLPSVAEASSVVDLSQPGDRRVPAVFVPHGEFLWTLTRDRSEGAVIYRFLYPDGKVDSRDVADVSARFGARCVAPEP